MNISISHWLSRSVFICALAASIGAAQAQNSNPVPGAAVATAEGKLAGTVLASGIHAYLGVPFAAPPVGNLRWHEPMPVKPWKDVYDASATKPACAQRSGGGINAQSSEDCLYVNVWTPPTAKAGDKLPVIVFIYGGGFSGGSASTPAYSGEQLARKGVVTVNLAYRVGVFGYFAHPELSKESGHNASGDWGSLDQVAGLKWIQRNIAAFGGDPKNVLVMGHSAGGESVYQLQASPLARGLFAKLSPWSGADLAPGGQVPKTLAEGEAQGLKVQQMLNANNVSEMRAMPWQQIMAALPAGGPGAPGGGIQTRPVIDGYFLPDAPDKIFKAGKHNDVPLYTSSAEEDLGSATQFYNEVKTVADLQTLAKSVFGASADDFMKLFPATSDQEARKVALTVSGNTGFGVSNRDWARDAALHGKQPVYLVHWTHAPPAVKPGASGAPAMAGNGATHGSDIQYWLGTYAMSDAREWTSWDKELSEKMQDTMIAFARTSNPVTSAVNVPRYDPNNEQRIVFGDSIYVEKMNTEQIEFLRAHPVPRVQAGAVR